MGQCRLIALGFRQGGQAGYGLRLLLLDQSGAVKTELARGEHKSLQTNRVILRPGPAEEVATVNPRYSNYCKRIADLMMPKASSTARRNELPCQT